MAGGIGNNLSLGGKIGGLSVPKRDMSIQDIQAQLSQDLPGVDLSKMSKADGPEQKNLAEKLSFSDPVVDSSGDVQTTGVSKKKWSFGNAFRAFRNISIKGSVKQVRSFMSNKYESGDASKLDGDIKSLRKGVVSSFSKRLGFIKRRLAPKGIRKSYARFALNQAAQKKVGFSYSKDETVKSGALSKKDFHRMKNWVKFDSSKGENLMAGVDSMATFKSAAESEIRSEFSHVLNCKPDEVPQEKIDFGVSRLLRSHNQAVGLGIGVLAQEELMTLIDAEVQDLVSDNQSVIEAQGLNPATTTAFSDFTPNELSKSAKLEINGDVAEYTYDAEIELRSSASGDVPVTLKTRSSVRIPLYGNFSPVVSSSIREINTEGLDGNVVFSDGQNQFESPYDFTTLLHDYLALRLAS